MGNNFVEEYGIFAIINLWVIFLWMIYHIPHLSPATCKNKEKGIFAFFR
jgi:hypothetical protein